MQTNCNVWIFYGITACYSLQILACNIPGKRTKMAITMTFLLFNRLCGLVVRVPGYRSRGPGLTPGAIRFLRSSGSRTGSTQPREYN
jgi:hypothetical protein